MSKYLCITLDLEPDYAGEMPEAYRSCEPEFVQPVAALIAKYDIKLTVFVTGRLLEMNHPAIKTFQSLNAEFCLHSYSHDLTAPDSLTEIRQGKAAFESYFGEAPAGYRTPQGRITSAGLERLAQEGFRYDSSVIPSYWPSIFYLGYPRNPYYPNGQDLLELPLTTLPFCRFTVSLSWIKLLGWPIYYLGCTLLPLPRYLLFNVHLYDFFTPSVSYAQLPRRWKTVYGRNRDTGVVLFEKFIRLMMKQNYEFAYVRDVSAYCRQELPPPEHASAGPS